MCNPFTSEILTAKQSFELLKLCDFNFKAKWKLLYRESKHGFASKNFHSKCDGYENTLTIIQANPSSYIFGAFTSTIWDHSNRYKYDKDAFIYSLTNKENLPCKMSILTNKIQNAICCWSILGPSFGNGDIRICEIIGNCSDLGNTFLHPKYKRGTNEAQSFLAGSHHFQVRDIEVYYKV